MVPTWLYLTRSGVRSVTHPERQFDQLYQYFTRPKDLRFSAVVHGLDSYEEAWLEATLM
jgi:hypothetical protein